MENRVAMFEEVSVSIKYTKSPKLLKTLAHGKLKVRSESHTHLAWSHNHRQCSTSSRCSSHRLLLLLGRICL